MSDGARGRPQADDPKERINLRIHGSFVPRLKAAAAREGMKKTAWARMASERAIEESERQQVPGATEHGVRRK